MSTASGTYAYDKSVNYVPAAQVLNMDEEGWIKIKGITKPHFFLHKDIHKNHIKKV